MIKGEEKLHIKIVIRKVAGENIVKKKTQIVTKLKILHIIKLKIWQLQNLNCDSTKQLRLWHSSIYDKTQKLILWQNSKLNISTTQIVTKLKKILLKNWKTEKLKNSKYGKTNNQIITNLKIPIVTIIKNTNCDKTEVGTKLNSTQPFTLRQNSKTSIIIKNWKKLYSNKNLFLTNSLFVKTTWHVDNWWYVLGAAFCNLAMCYQIMSFGYVG